MDFKEITQDSEVEEFKKYYEDYCKFYRAAVDKIKKSNYEHRISMLNNAIENYAGYEYRKINTYLRNITNEKDIALEATIDEINKLIIAAPNLKENIIVYRSIPRNVVDIILDETNKSSIYHEKGFMSTSIRLNTVLEHHPSDIILKIQVPKNVSALYIDGIQDRDEEELLFPTDQGLRYERHYTNKKLNITIYEFFLLP